MLCHVITRFAACDPRAATARHGYADPGAYGFLSGRGRIVGRVANLPQNTLKIEKTPDFGHFIRESGGFETPGFQKCGGQDPPVATPCADHPKNILMESFISVLHLDFHAIYFKEVG